MSEAANSPEGGGQRQLGRYLLLRTLGRGAMGIVVEAEDTLLRRRVAVKVLAPALVDDPDALRRFLREGQALAAQPFHGGRAGCMGTLVNTLPYWSPCSGSALVANLSWG